MNLSFRLGRIPVQIRSSFFVLTLILNFGLAGADPLRFVLWMAVVLASVLAHELGHAAVARAFGLSPSIALHGFGGTTSWAHSPAIGPRRRIAISLAGPGTGLVVGAALAVAIAAFGPGEDFVARALGGPFGLGHPLAARTLAEFAMAQLLFVNVGWGILNLLPALPLDGGEVMSQLLVLAGQGEHAAYVVSLCVAAAATLAAVVAGWWWPALLAASFAASNWSSLRRTREARRSEP